MEKKLEKKFYALYNKDVILISRKAAGIFTHNVELFLEMKKERKKENRTQ